MKTLLLSFLIAAISFTSFATERRLSQEYIEQLDEFSRAMNDENTLPSFVKIARVTRSFGAYLLEMFSRGDHPNGEELIAMKKTMRTFLQVTTRLETEIRMGGHTEETLIILIENFKAVHDLYFSETVLRRLVKSQSTFNAYGKSLRIDETRNRVLSEIHQKNLERYLATRPPESLTSQGLIANTYAEDKNLDKIFADKSHFSDVFQSSFQKFTVGLSKTYGDIAGPVEFRVGHLYRKPELLKEIRGKLKPLDLLFEKKEFKLTDYTIPGHWGHVGIYLGTEAELKALGLWDLKWMKPFHQAIKNGNDIFEFRRWGSQFDSLDHWMNLDHMAIVRYPKILEYKRTDLEEVFRRLFSQVELAYDFSFNALSTEKIICTGIITLSYGSIDWPSQEILGRFTISPNDMAKLVFYDNSPLEFIAYYSGTSGKINRHSKEEFGQTISFVPSKKEDGGFDFYERTCERERFRQRGRGGIRFQNRCQDNFTRMKYEEIKGQYNPFSGEADDR